MTAMKPSYYSRAHLAVARPSPTAATEAVRPSDSYQFRSLRASGYSSSGSVRSTLRCRLEQDTPAGHGERCVSTDRGGWQLVVLRPVQRKSKSVSQCR